MRWICFLASAALLMAGERQLTHSSRNHALDNNDNFSPGGRYLCFDTRGSGQAIGIVDVQTGEERTLYTAETTVMAASFHPQRDEVVFIHGPVGEAYAKTNRRGAVVDLSGKVRFLDSRDAAAPMTPPGAHRGGTHRHEYTADGTRVGFTYDDHLLPAYGRTIGMAVPRKDAPGGATHWFAVLVRVVPEAAAKPGDLTMAASDSWVGPAGLVRAFIGRVKEADGGFRNSLYVVDVPAGVDVATAFAGDGSRYPEPPRGVRVRRLMTGEASGIVRGSPDGTQIAFLAADGDGAKQVFAIDTAGGTPRQVTRVAGGVRGNPRWHPSGRFVAVPSGKGIAVAEVATGKTVFVTGPGGDALVWSPDGRTLAFNRKVGEFVQIFVADFDLE